MPRIELMMSLFAGVSGGLVGVLWSGFVTMPWLSRLRPEATAALRREDSMTLFAQALRHALTERDLTLDRVQARLAERGISVGRSTLSFWQNGRRVPRGLSSLRVVAALEEILDVTPGLLTGPLGENPTPGEHVTLGSADDQVGDLLDVIDAGSLLDAIRVRQGITRVWVSQTGGYDRIDVDLVLRATRPINRIPIVDEEGRLMGIVTRTDFLKRYCSTGI